MHRNDSHQMEAGFVQGSFFIPGESGVGSEARKGYSDTDSKKQYFK